MKALQGDEMDGKVMGWVGGRMDVVMGLQDDGMGDKVMGCNGDEVGG